MKSRTFILAGAAFLASSTLATAQTEPASTQAAAATSRKLEIVPTISSADAFKKVPEKQQSSYLLAYFKDEDHSLHFAVSRDGYAFTDVNNGAPVLEGRDISEQKGIRDPHIVRGPDNAFYLAMTDLHIYAQREGIRSTEWERPREQFGWGNNRSLILMKSYDLVHWTHSIVHVEDLFPEEAPMGAAWAPETIYDPAVGKMMVYYTTRKNTGPNHIVYSYADDAFTTLTTKPKEIFTYPKAGISTIDGDITKVGNKYHLFYVAHDKPGHLRQAISSKLNEGYVYNPTPVDPEEVGTEAPNLWRRHGTNKYVLMYDVFGANPNNMGFSETTDFVRFTNLGHFNDPGSPMKATNFSGPKHGAVIPLSTAEVDALTKHFSRK